MGRRVSQWRKVIEIALRVKAKTDKFVVLRGYSALEIANYLLERFSEKLSNEEKELLREVQKQLGSQITQDPVRSVRSVRKRRYVLSERACMREKKDS